MDTFFVFQTPFFGEFFEKQMKLIYPQMRTCFFPKNVPKKGVRKTKKCALKKTIPKKWGKYFKKKQK